MKLLCMISCVQGGVIFCLKRMLREIVETWKKTDSRSICFQYRINIFGYISLFERKRYNVLMISRCCLKNWMRCISPLSDKNVISLPYWLCSFCNCVLPDPLHRVHDFFDAFWMNISIQFFFYSLAKNDKTWHLDSASGTACTSTDKHQEN